MMACFRQISLASSSKMPTAGNWKSLLVAWGEGCSHLIHRFDTTHSNLSVLFRRQFLASFSSALFPIPFPSLFPFPFPFTVLFQSSSCPFRVLPVPASFPCVRCPFPAPFSGVLFRCVSASFWERPFPASFSRVLFLRPFPASFSGVLFLRVLFRRPLPAPLFWRVSAPAILLPPVFSGQALASHALFTRSSQAQGFMHPLQPQAHQGLQKGIPSRIPHAQSKHAPACA